MKQTKTIVENLIKEQERIENERLKRIKSLTNSVIYTNLKMMNDKKEKEKEIKNIERVENFKKNLYASEYTTKLIKQKKNLKINIGKEDLNTQKSNNLTTRVNTGNTNGYKLSYSSFNTNNTSSIFKSSNIKLGNGNLFQREINKYLGEK
jgi:hypothetical protein